MIEARATHDDFEPTTIRMLEVLELTYSGKLWPEETPTRQQLIDELQRTGLVKRIPRVNEPKAGLHLPERYELTDAGTAKTEELQRMYRGLIADLHFDPLPNLDCVLGAASSTAIGGSPEPIDTLGIMFGAPTASLWKKRLPGVTVSTTPDGIWMVTNAIESPLEVHCKTVGRELHLSAEFARNMRLVPWGHRGIGWTLSLVPPPETAEAD